jgi:Flp pilus assembly pilin Flp
MGACGSFTGIWGTFNSGITDHIMKRLLLSFLCEESGQDLIEYSLLLAFVAFTSAGLAMGFSSSIAGIVSTSNSQLVAANLQAS